MVKSNRRKKQDRDKAAVGRAEQERRRTRAERERQSAGHFEQLNDPSVSPADVAGILAAEFPDRVLAAGMMRLRMSLGVPAEEITETARLLLEGTAPEPPGIGALAVAALAAHLAGDEDAEHDYARELLARADASGDPGQRIAVIGSATGRDHPGETCELIGLYLREHPDDELAASIYARALAKAYVQAEPGELETAALERYGDRSGADALDHAVGEFAERTQWGAIIRKWMEEERADPRRDRWRPAERDATDALLAEVAINFLFTSEAADGDEDTPLRAFAAALETAAELAARAAERDQHIRYGVWQLADPSPSPGVWCTDLVSGTQRYAQFPTEVIDGAPPWSAWLGALTPADGIWRATRAGIWLSPVEGDAVAEYAEDAVWHLLHTVTGAPGPQAPAMEQVRFGQAEPYCVRWETGEEPEPEFGDFSSPVIARLAPRLASWVWLKRAERVLLQNTDGEPMVLVDAVVEVDGDVTERLFERSDFGEEEDGEDGQFVWWGEPAVDRSGEPVVLRFHDDGSAHDALFLIIVWARHVRGSVVVEAQHDRLAGAIDGRLAPPDELAVLAILFLPEVRTLEQPLRHVPVDLDHRVDEDHGLAVGVLQQHPFRALQPDPGCQPGREPGDDRAGEIPELRLRFLTGLPAHAVRLGLPEPDLLHRGRLGTRRARYRVQQVPDRVFGVLRDRVTFYRAEPDPGPGGAPDAIRRRQRAQPRRPRRRAVDHLRRKLGVPLRSRHQIGAPYAGRRRRVRQLPDPVAYVLVPLGRPGRKFGRRLQGRRERAQRSVLVPVCRLAGEEEVDRHLGQQRVGRIPLGGPPAVSPRVGSLLLHPFADDRAPLGPLRELTDRVVQGVGARTVAVPLQGGRLQFAGLGLDVRLCQRACVDARRQLVIGMLPQVQPDQLACLARVVPARGRADHRDPLPGIA